MLFQLLSHAPMPPSASSFASLRRLPRVRYLPVVPSVAMKSRNTTRFSTRVLFEAPAPVPKEEFQEWETKDEEQPEVTEEEARLLAMMGWSGTPDGVK